MWFIGLILLFFVSAGLAKALQAAGVEADFGNLTGGIAGALFVVIGLIALLSAA